MGLKPLICGPFSAVRSTGGAKVVIPIATDGEWKKTEEGQHRLARAVHTLNCATDEDLIHRDSEINFVTDDHAVLTIPCDSYHEAEVKAHALKKLLPKWIDASVMEQTRTRDT